MRVRAHTWRIPCRIFNCSYLRFLPCPSTVSLDGWTVLLPCSGYVYSQPVHHPMALLTNASVTRHRRPLARLHARRATQTSEHRRMPARELPSSRAVSPLRLLTKTLTIATSIPPAGGRFPFALLTSTVSCKQS